MYRDASDERRELEKNVLAFPRSSCVGSGYVVDCLHSARIALQQDSYEAVVKTAIAFGRDTDTTACVAGGLAGIRWGIDHIPRRWLNALRGQQMFEDELRSLLMRPSL